MKNAQRPQEMLRVWKKSQGLNGFELGSKLNIHPKIISNLENNKRLPTFEQALKIELASDGLITVESWGIPDIRRVIREAYGKDSA